MSRKLFLIPTLLAPDTYQSVLPVYVKEVCEEISYFLSEEVRTSRRFLSGLKMEAKIQDKFFFTLNKDTTLAELKEIIKQIPENENIGVMSEAGCPGIADPGSMVVKLAHEKKWEIVPLVGPSSILLALMGSGLNGQSFAFHGYLPVESPDRIKAIKDLEKESIQLGRTQIFIETPYRNNKMIEDLMQACKPETLICLAANLTGDNPFLKTKTIREWKSEIPDLHKIPVVFLILGK